MILPFRKGGIGLQGERRKVSPIPRYSLLEPLTGAFASFLNWDDVVRFWPQVSPMDTWLVYIC